MVVVAVVAAEEVGAGLPLVDEASGAETAAGAGRLLACHLQVIHMVPRVATMPPLRDIQVPEAMDRHRECMERLHQAEAMALPLLIGRLIVDCIVSVNIVCMFF